MAGKTTLTLPSCPYAERFEPFCRSANTRGIEIPGEKGDWGYARCARCGTIVIDRYTDVEGVYEREKLATRYPPLHPLVRLKHRLLGHPIERHFGRKDFAGLDVLDVGCGNGAKLYDFFRRGARVAGIELSDEKIAIARRHMPDGRFFVGYLRDVGLAERSFDIVTLDNVLEHIPDPDAMVREVYEYLKPGGKAVFYVPNGKALTVRWLKHNALNVWPPFHLHLFTAEYFHIHFPDLSVSCITRSHFFLVRNSLRRLLRNRWLSGLLAMVLLPFANEELAVTVERPS